MSKTIALISSKGSYTIERDVLHTNFDVCSDYVNLVIIEYANDKFREIRYNSLEEEISTYDLNSLASASLANLSDALHYARQRLKNREEDVELMQLFMEHKLTAQMLLDRNMELQTIKRTNGVDIIPTWTYRPELVFVEETLQEAYEAIEKYELLNPDRCLNRLKQEQNATRVYEYVIEHRLEIMEQLLKTTTT